MMPDLFVRLTLQVDKIINIILMFILYIKSAKSGLWMDYII